MKIYKDWNDVSKELGFDNIPEPGSEEKEEKRDAKDKEVSLDQKKAILQEKVAQLLEAVEEEDIDELFDELVPILESHAKDEEEEEVKEDEEDDDWDRYGKAEGPVKPGSKPKGFVVSTVTTIVKPKKPGDKSVNIEDLGKNLPFDFMD